MNKFDKNFWVPYIIFLALILIRLIPFFYPESRTWGFSHLIFLPEIYSFGFFAISALALVLPFSKKSEQWGESVANWFSFNFVEGPKRYINRIIFISIMALLFIIYSTPTHFLGDSYMYIKILDRVSGVYVDWDQTAVFKWSEIGVAKFMIFARSLISECADNKALFSFQIISVLAGIINIWFFFKISQIATKDKTKRLLIFGSSILSGAILMFFGYAEYYHIIWAFQTAYIYFALKYIVTAKGLIIAWIILLVGTVFHLQMAIFLPATVYLTFSTGKGLSFYRKYKIIVWGTATLAALAVGAVVIYKYLNDLYIQDMFLTLFQGKPVDPDYAIFSLPHLIDICNEIILIAPLAFILLFVSIVNIKNRVVNSRQIFLGLSAVGCLLFLFTIDPQLAMPRDWDLFSITPYIIMLLSIILIPEFVVNSLKKFVVPFLILLTISTLPFLLTNLDRERSVDYFEYFINLDKPRAHYSYIVLADYYRSMGEPEKADSLKNIFNENYPQMNQYNRAMTAMDNGNLDLTLNILNGIKADRYDGDYQRVWGRYYYMRGDLIKALKYLDRAIQLRQYNSIYFWQRAMIYVGLTKNEKAHEDLLRAYDLDNSSLRVLDGLSFMYYSDKKYDSSIYFAKEMIRIDSNQLGAYYLLANSYYMLKSYNNASQCARHFIEKTEGANIYNTQRQQLNSMINSIGEGSKAP